MNELTSIYIGSPQALMDQLLWYICNCLYLYGIVMIIAVTVAATLNLFHNSKDYIARLRQTIVLQQYKNICRRYSDMIEK